MRLEMKRRKAGCKKKPVQNACWNRNICTTEAPQGVVGHETPRLAQSLQETLRRHKGLRV